MTQLENIINNAFEQRADITPANASAEVRDAVNEALTLLDTGKARVAEKINGDWVTNQWLKKAVLTVIPYQRKSPDGWRQHPLL